MVRVVVWQGSFLINNLCYFCFFSQYFIDFECIIYVHERMCGDGAWEWVKGNRMKSQPHNPLQPRVYSLVTCRLPVTETGEYNDGIGWVWCYVTYWNWYNIIMMLLYGGVCHDGSMKTLRRKKFVEWDEGVVLFSMRFFFLFLLWIFNKLFSFIVHIHSFVFIFFQFQLHSCCNYFHFN